MTLEQAKSELMQIYMSLSEEKKKALDVAFKAMEQADRGFNEWCHDCKEYDQEKHCCPRFNRVIRETVAEIQADKPQEPKTGHWEDDSPISWICSECGYQVLRYNNTDWCPSCGAKMVDKQESEKINCKSTKETTELPDNMCTQRCCLKNHNIGIIECNEECYNRTLF